MSSKLIHFDCDGQNIHAEAVYSFNDFSDIIVIIPNTGVKDLNENILLIRINRKWTTLSALKEQFPSTIQNIINSVNKEFENIMKGIFT